MRPQCLWWSFRLHLLLTARSTCSSSQLWSKPINTISILSHLGTQKCYKGLSAVSPRSPQTAYFPLRSHCPHILQLNEAQTIPLAFKHTNLIVLLSFFLLCISDKNLSISCNFKHSTCSDFSQSAQPQLLQYRPPSLWSIWTVLFWVLYTVSSQCPKGVLPHHSH